MEDAERLPKSENELVHTNDLRIVYPVRSFCKNWA